MSVGPVTAAFAPPVAPAASPRTGFEAAFDAALGELGRTQAGADAALADLAAGRRTDIHDVMIALQEADITLRAAVAVRDKVVAAYKDLMNMQM